MGCKGRGLQFSGANRELLEKKR
uniref:Uncharacterized protein n=1 Tax=Arundo donax TaxID=35708 RepID=A0A0A9ARY8_ARUDO